MKSILCGKNGSDTAAAAASEPLLRGEVCVCVYAITVTVSVCVCVCVCVFVQDSDVYAERKRVLSGDTTENDAVVIKNLVKVCALR